MSLFYFDSQFSLLCCVSLIFLSFALLYYYRPRPACFHWCSACFCVISPLSYLSLSLSLLDGLLRLTFSCPSSVGLLFCGYF